MSIACSICLDTYSTDEGVITLSGCGHVYHLDCIENWKRTAKVSPPKCPLCQKNYNKRSITKLYFHVEDVENTQLNQELKKQKLISDNLIKDKENLESEVQRARTSWTIVIQELNKIKQDYGIKCQAYNIIDTVNNEYLQNNERLQAENSLLKQVTAQLKTEFDELKKTNLSLLQESQQSKSKQFVDLTADDDDDVQIIESTKNDCIIEINDDDDDSREQERRSSIQAKLGDGCERNPQDDRPFKSNDAEEEAATEDECDEKNQKEFQEIDYNSFENFLMSQIRSF